MCCLSFLVCYRRRTTNLCKLLPVKKFQNMFAMQNNSCVQVEYGQTLFWFKYSKIIKPIKYATKLWNRLQLLFLVSQVKCINLGKLSVLQFSPFEVNTLYMTATFCYCVAIDSKQVNSLVVHWSTWFNLCF